MKNIDWDERRYQIILNLTKNVTISDRSGVPFREIEAMADELISYMQVKSDGCKDFDDKMSLIIKTVKDIPGIIRREKFLFGADNNQYNQGLRDATDKIISLIEKIRKDNEKV